MRRVKQRKNSGDVYGGTPANFDRRHTHLKLGDHLVQCDVTGQVCFASETRKTWRGTIASKQNWDVRHPQLDIEVNAEDISVTDARPFNSSDQTLPSDALANGSVVLSDASIEQVSGTATMTFKSDGTLEFNGSPVAGEWWSQGATENIGNFFQVRFWRYAEVGNVVSVDGVTSRFQSLSEDRSISTTFGGTGSIDYFIEILNINTDEVTTAAIMQQQT